MLKRLAIPTGLITLGLGTIFVLSIGSTTPASASCKTNFEDCVHVAILHCGGETFVGGSDIGNAVDIARIKARSAGHDPDECKVRNRY